MVPVYLVYDIEYTYPRVSSIRWANRYILISSLHSVVDIQAGKTILGRMCDTHLIITRF